MNKDKINMHGKDEKDPKNSFLDQVAKVFLNCADGKVEKAFIDHGARPRRTYRTGEFYRPLDRRDVMPCSGEEDVMRYNPENFEEQWYRRVSPIDQCVYPKQFPGEKPPGHHLYAAETPDE